MSLYMISVQLCRITVYVSRSRVLGRGDICHLNAENQGSSQVSGSSRNSGMQIEISHCRAVPVHPYIHACVCLYFSRIYAYIIYRTAHRRYRRSLLLLKKRGHFGHNCYVAHTRNIRHKLQICCFM